MKTGDLLRAAKAAEFTGQIEKAVQLAHVVLEGDPTSVDALLLLGSAAARRGQLEEAEAFLRRALASDPRCFDAARWLATLLIGKQGGDEAVHFAEIAVNLRPKAPESYIALGLAALGVGDNPTAISSFERTVELSPHTSGAFHNLGVALHRDECYSDAIVAFKKAIALAPNVAETHLHLGRSYLANDQGDEAVLCADRVLELNPQSGAAKRLRADASFAAVLGENGEENIRLAMTRDPKSGFPYALMGSRFQEQGQFEASEESLLKSIDLQPQQGLAYYLLAHNRKVSDADRTRFEGLEGLSDTNSLDPVDEAYLNFGLGKAFDDLREYEKAMKYLDRANGDSHSKNAIDKPQGKDRFANRIQRFIEVVTPEFLNRYRDIGIESEEPIFIFGMPRSGTTLLEQIVSRHSKVGAAGEQSFWRDSGRRIIDLREGVLFPQELHRAGQRYLDLIRSIAPGKEHVTEKFPSNYIYLGLLHLIFPRARFLHCQRHPIDTCLSMYMRPFSSPDVPGGARRALVKAYRLYQESMDHWRKVLPPGRFLDVQYEELVTNPETVIPQIIEYCGLPWENACLHPEEGERRVITFSKWQVRQPVYTSSVERWRNYEPWLGAFRDLLDP